MRRTQTVVTIRVREKGETYSTAMFPSIDVSYVLAAFSLLAVVTVDGILVNVALNKTCNMSSSQDNTRIQESCRRALNGDTGGKHIGTQNCIHTQVGDPNPWFEVDLGRPYPIVAIIVLARSTYERRMANCEVTVDGQECYHFPEDTSSFSREMHINCTNALSGRLVRVSKHIVGKPDWDQPLNMCELQVLSCAEEAWGRGCDQQCGHCEGEEVCDKVTGHCTHCAEGFQPPFCVSFQNATTSVGYRTTAAAYLVSGALAAALSATALPWTPR